jgi:hypothetical protein
LFVLNQFNVDYYTYYNFIIIICVGACSSWETGDATICKTQGPLFGAGTKFKRVQRAATRFRQSRSMAAVTA